MSRLSRIEESDWTARANPAESMSRRSLTTRMKSKGDPAFEELGGVRYLADLVDRAPPAANAPDYANAIYDLAFDMGAIDPKANAPRLPNRADWPPISRSYQVGFRCPPVKRLASPLPAEIPIIAIVKGSGIVLSPYCPLALNTNVGMNPVHSVAPVL